MRSGQIGKLLCIVLGFLLLGITAGCGGGNSSGGNGNGGGNPTGVSLVVDQLGVTTYPATTFHVLVKATTFGTTGTPTISFALAGMHNRRYCIRQAKLPLCNTPH
jgi:hypothetical protein